MSTGFVEFRELYRYAQNNRGEIVFYDRFVYLCEQKGISPSRAAIEAGISKSLVTKWKVNEVEIPSADVIKKLTTYFNVSTSYLLGEEIKNAPTSDGKRVVTDDDIKFALFKGNGNITDDMLDEVKAFAAFVQQRENNKEKP